MLIAFIIFSICLITSGNMPLFGGKRARGKLIRFVGVIILGLSVLMFFIPTKTSVIITIVIMSGITVTYFLLKGENPTEQELKLYGFKSSKDELNTYAAAAKGIFAFIVTIGLAMGWLFVIGKLIV